jgi:hypothetical protein
MKYGYRSEEDRVIRDFWGKGKIGEMVANFMTDYYQPLMKRKSIKNEEIEMLKYFKEMAEELLEHLENNVEKK